VNLFPALKRVRARMRFELGVAVVLVVASLTMCEVARAEIEPATSGGPATFRRLSEAQYTRSIEDIFGAGIKVPGRFEPPLREDGLMAIGDSKVVVSASGFEQYELRAREVAAQVLAADRRKNVLSCAPRSPEVFDKSCASQFLGKYGRLLFHRPVTEAEMNSALTVTSATTERLGNFYKGLEAGLARFLASPNFIFRIEHTEGKSGPTRRLDDYSLATRISFLLWNASPDAELLDAAASGALRKPDGLEKQVDRLINSPRFADGVRAFFSDMFAYEQFDGLSKDQAIFPKFTSQLSKEAAEQMMRTIVDLLVTNKGDYRDLFTTKKTFLSRKLASVYKVPVSGSILVDGWIPYTFGPDDPRSGILTFAAFLMLDPTHEGKTSPTIRGKSLRELFLCQKIPPAPGNVDFSKFQDPKNPNATVRERLTAHRENPTCAGCHAIMDPVGLAMENYDAIGTYRTAENGVVIDASGSFEGKPYKDVIGLEHVLHDSPVVPNCAAERAYEYGVGRPVMAGEREWLKYTSERFAADNYAFSALMRRIATSKAFQTVSADIGASQKLAQVRPLPSPNAPGASNGKLD
jgi:hypothetical protein